MEFVLRACGELSRAQIALKGLLSCVDSYVFLKIPILVEGLLTIRTLEGFRPIVPSHVRYKAGSVFELLPTLVTKELGLQRVNSFVRGQVALSLERLVALVTGKGALASVCLEMSSQEISDFESLLAPLVSTGVDLSIVHGEPVICEAGLRRKISPTILLGTGEHLAANGDVCCLFTRKCRGIGADDRLIAIYSCLIGY